MPKLNIDDCTTDSWRAEVNWAAQMGGERSSSGHVQVATVNRDSPFEFPEKRTADSFEAAEPFDGWRVTLDRDGCNRMIHALRRARDAAYGKDA